VPSTRPRAGSQMGFLTDDYLSDMLKGMLKYWHHVSEEIAD